MTQLHVGARIVREDVTVTVTQFEITGEWVHYAIDTGEFISLPYDEARKLRLTVLV